MNIPANRLDRAFLMHQSEYEEAALRVLRSGYYVLGNEVARFEEEFAAYIGTPYCVGLASGLDALWMAFRILNIGSGDEVIVQANAYIACVMGITMNGAHPIFVEPDRYHNIDVDRIEAAITEKTKAILAVHLYGQASDMEAIVRIAEKHKLYVIEDCAQSHGAGQNGQKMGTFGHIGCFSFYPSKNLGAFGDAGAVVGNSAEIAEAFRIYRNYGSKNRYYNAVIGTNSRLDEIQAALLRIRLSHLDELNRERQSLCERYLKELKHPDLELPSINTGSGCDTVWHQFVIRVSNREKLMEHLRARNISTAIHYPVSPHRQEAYRGLGYQKGEFPVAEAYADTVLSLPLFPGMTDKEQSYVIAAVNQWEKPL